MGRETNPKEGERERSNLDDFDGLGSGDGSFWEIGDSLDAGGRDEKGKGGQRE